MRLCLIFVLTASLALSQSQTSRATGLDVNGNPLTSYSIQAQDANGLKRTEQTRSPNGDWIPRLHTEERVLRESGGTRVVERIERQFGPDGRALEPRRTVMEETRRADGTSTSQIRVYLGDGNGGQRLVELATQEVRVVDGQTATQTEIRRPDLNGSLSVAERVFETRSKEPGGMERQLVSTFRPDANGSFFESERRVSESRGDGQRTTEQLTIYNTVSGPLAIAEQRVVQTALSADGSASRVTDIFMPGVGSTDGTIRLVQRELSERRATGRGGYDETVSVQQPLLNEPGRLGPPEVQSRSSCAGDCLPKPAKP